MTSLKKCKWVGQVSSLDHFIYNSTIALESVTELDTDISNEGVGSAIVSFGKKIIALLKRMIENIKQTVKALFAKLGVGLTLKDLTNLQSNIRKSREIKFTFNELKKLTKVGWNVSVTIVNGRTREYIAKDIRNGYDAYATATVRTLDFLRDPSRFVLLNDRTVGQLMSAAMDDTYMLFGLKPTRFELQDDKFTVIQDEIKDRKTLMPFNYPAHYAEDDINYLIEIMKRYEITGPASKFIERNIDLSLKYLSSVEPWIDDNTFGREDLIKVKQLLSQLLNIMISDVSVSLVRGIRDVYLVYSRAVSRLKYSDKTD